MSVGPALVTLVMTVGLGPTPSQAAYFDFDQYDYIYYIYYIYSTSSGFHQLGIFDYSAWRWLGYARTWGTSFGDYWGVWWNGTACRTWYPSRVVMGGDINDVLFRYDPCPIY